ncbi:hypothetical protein SK571_45630 [Lentzea sp. BCCO 10_0798]|uniref:Uncharacterized protein n=1 Tax=Lentzea kristufekii TaxID=3095430 RepID=A0ABU4U7W2_9PSEU|nr:hypothetical protein [Lentzea sp. BCCO 10_0798]MDX8056694.1 hypothetical protein [Lentzea sp. BCCO 10_0798]
MSGALSAGRPGGDRAHRLDARRHLYITQGTPNVFPWFVAAAPLIAWVGVLVKFLPVVTAWIFFAALVPDERILIELFRR